MIYEKTESTVAKYLKRTLLIGLGVLVGGVLFFPFLKYCQERLPARTSFGKSAVVDAEKTDQSYVLFSPFAQNQNLSDPGRVYLTDLFGHPVHTWDTKYQALYSTLKKNGHLLVALIEPADLLANPGGGGTGLIQELDWESNVVWQYENKGLHHDFDVLPNGNVVALLWDQLFDDRASRIRGGKKSSHDPQVWGDAIVEIDTQGKEVWRWSTAFELDPEKYPIGPLTPRSEWTHGNSVRYYPTNPFTRKPAYLVSFRHINRVMLIERESRRVLWESKEGTLSFQHDPTLLENGNILVFDNGMFRDQERPFLWSRVVEIDPRTDKIAWQFTGGSTGPEQARLSPSIMGGAQRLQNGNTFIVNSVQGMMLEVTPEKKIVWEMLNPYAAPTTGPWLNNALFKARRYQPLEVEWPEKLPSPSGDAVSATCKWFQ
ncbi:MAG: arylsulfotransferase family protein [Undibacterium sp.]